MVREPDETPEAKPELAEAVEEERPELADAIVDEPGTCRHVCTPPATQTRSEVVEVLAL